MDDELTQIGDYRVIRLLGSGGMGEVYLAQHPRLPRRDAVKLLDPTVSRNDEFRARFEREADLLAPLRHANIITIHDRGQLGRRLWLAMEYIDGPDAAQLLKQQGALPVDQVLQIIEGTGAALDYAYTKGQITHRDVKPANILVELDAHGRIETVKLADFGIAKAAGEANSLTSTGMTIGTMAYISPEAIEGRELDNRADIYSLGCTAFELLTGTTPFTAGSLPALMMAHVGQPVPAITGRNPALPPEADVVFARVLAKDPADRYPSCREFTTALQHALANTTTTGPWIPVVAAPAATTTSPPVSYGVISPAEHAHAIPAETRIAGQQHAVPAETRIAGQQPPPAVTAAPKRKMLKAKVVVPALAIVLLLVAGGVFVVKRHFFPSPPDWAAHRVELPFTGLHSPKGVAVDSAGNVYVADFDDANAKQRGRVLKLAAGADSATELPFPGLDTPAGVAVDTLGNLYVAGNTNGRDKDVWKLAPGSSAPDRLPISGELDGVAVDASNTVYTIDFEGGGFTKLPQGATESIHVPISDLKDTNGIAVATDGTIYVTGGPNAEDVWRVAPGATTATSVFTGLGVNGAAVDRDGTLYVSDEIWRVWRFAPGDGAPTYLDTDPGIFGRGKADLQPSGVAVDSAGAVYVSTNNGSFGDGGKVLKLTRN